MNLVVEAIRAVQTINERVERMATAPAPGRYPAALDSVRLPITMTDVLDGQFGQGRGDSISGRLQMRVYTQAIGQGDHAANQVNIAELIGNIRAIYSDAGTYLTTSFEEAFVVSTEPHIELFPPFEFRRFTRPQQYPEGANRFFLGFDVIVNFLARDGDLCQ